MQNTETTDNRRTDDTGVLRKYFEARPNQMFSPVQCACIRFVHYAESVPCVLCGRLSKYHWTCVVRFKAADVRKSKFVLKLNRRWFKAGDPVCHGHPTETMQRRVR
jgi:hypothetical protein